MLVGKYYTLSWKLKEDFGKSWYQAKRKCTDIPKNSSSIYQKSAVLCQDHQIIKNERKKDNNNNNNNNDNDNNNNNNNNNYNNNSNNNNNNNK